MPSPVRPRRSMLYMPGSNARALDKGRSLAADCIIFDLEDAVAEDAKPQARQQIAKALGDGGYGRRELLVRINGLDTPHGEADIAAMAGSGAHALLLPKVESAGTVQRVETLMRRHGAPDDMAIWCMIETPRGILRAEEIAAASPRVGGFLMGTNDLAKELHCLQTPDRQPFMTSFGLCILVARAYGIAVIDGVFPDLGDEAGFAASCRQGRALGFDGKSLIHPKTLAVANGIFGPSPEEIAWARRIAAAHAAALAEGKAVVLVDGKLVEALHVAEAQRLVTLAEAIADIEAADA